jgi:hypothetical protein
MSCVILTSKETIYQTTEWVPVEMEATSKENHKKNKNRNRENAPDANPDDIPIGPDESIINNVRHKKFYDEQMKTTFAYDIPTKLQTPKLYDELDKMFGIVDMISVFTDMGYTLKQTMSSTVRDTIYTKFILTKNTSSTIQASNQQPAGSSFRTGYKKKSFNNKSNY